jgi:hypothetical protein
VVRGRVTQYDEHVLEGLAQPGVFLTQTPYFVGVVNTLNGSRVRCCRRIAHDIPDGLLRWLTTR